MFSVLISEKLSTQRAQRKSSKKTGKPKASEFREFALPRPQLVILLDAPVALARRHVGRKAARGYTTLEYKSIVQYVQHIASVKGAEYQSTLDELGVHVRQELEHALTLARQIDFLGGVPATSVPAVAQVARGRGISVIAFSTDSSVASRGVYLLSFLPESDVNRIVEYAATIGKRSFGALLPDNAYGNVVEAAFKQAVPKRGGRVVVFEKYGGDLQKRVRLRIEAAGFDVDYHGKKAAKARGEGNGRDLRHERAVGSMRHATVSPPRYGTSVPSPKS